jgi:hypothetical protein
MQHSWSAILTTYKCSKTVPEHALAVLLDDLVRGLNGNLLGHGVNVETLR